MRVLANSAGYVIAISTAPAVEPAIMERRGEGLSFLSVEEGIVEAEMFFVLGIEAMVAVCGLWTYCYSLVWRELVRGLSQLHGMGGVSELFVKVKFTRCHCAYNRRTVTENERRL